MVILRTPSDLDEEADVYLLSHEASHADDAPYVRHPCAEAIRELRQERPLAGAPVDQLVELLGTLYREATWSEGETCTEPLFQAVPEPRRYPLARLILKRYRRKFDAVIADEIHEYSSSRSAQTHAFHRLASLPGIPTIVLTGSRRAPRVYPHAAKGKPRWQSAKELPRVSSQPGNSSKVMLELVQALACLSTERSPE